MKPALAAGLALAAGEIAAHLIAPGVARERCPSCGCALHPLRAAAGRASSARADGAEKKGVVIDVPAGDYSIR